jgi:hypothetical protein
LTLPLLKENQISDKKDGGSFVMKSNSPLSGRKKMRASDELELLKLILDENLELKKKILRFIQKNLGKTSSVSSKSSKIQQKK